MRSPARGADVTQPEALTADPIERYGPLALRLLVYGWLSYFFYQAATTFNEYVPGQYWPFMLSTFRMFTFLPIHEAGHFIFSIFGRTLMILGGSFWQIAFPLIWFIIAAKQRSQVAPFPLFWVGENIMDVSLYMRDAPLRQMPLLGGHKSGHDWHNLFSAWGMLDSAGTWADVMYYSGAVICIAAIAGGIYLSVISFLHPGSEIAAFPAGRKPVSALEDSLDDFIDNRESRENRFS